MIQNEILVSTFVGSALASGAFAYCLFVLISSPEDRRSLKPFLFALGIGIITGIAGLPLFVRLAQV